MSRTAAILAVALTAACGGLGTPDLSTGEVRGRIVGATAGYVYPIGHPELKAALAADGSFRLKAPVGTNELVLFDSAVDPALAPNGWAGLLTVDVQGAEIAEVGDQAGLPAARTVLVGVRAYSGAMVRSPRFKAELVNPTTAAATVQDTVSTVASALLAPLPPSDYQITVSMDGFLPQVLQVPLSGTDATYEVVLDVDATAASPGCNATGGCESSDLACGDDGLCYQPPSSGAAGTCGDACGSGGVCQTGLSCVSSAGVATCEPTSGATCAEFLAGSCGNACGTNSWCQAGLSCGGGVCTPPAGSSCATYLSMVGASCLSGASCSQAVKDGVCYGLSTDHAGYCTSRCNADADCAPFPAGWVCNPDQQRCSPPPD